MLPDSLVEAKSTAAHYELSISQRQITCVPAQPAPAAPVSSPGTLNSSFFLQPLPLDDVKIFDLELIL
jgi:hypothetical protein